MAFRVFDPLRLWIRIDFYDVILMVLSVSMRDCNLFIQVGLYLDLNSKKNISNSSPNATFRFA